MVLSSSIGIAFQTPSAIKGYVESKGQKGETASVLPVPTVLVNKKGEMFEYINLITNNELMATCFWLF
jgi:hypothetical protein